MPDSSPTYSNPKTYISADNLVFYDGKLKDYIADVLADNFNVGSATQPVFTSGGTAFACTHTLEADVPEEAAFTDESVTSAANHYTPTKDNSATKSASGGTPSAGSTVQVITGIETDGKGHVTGIVSGAATDTTYNNFGGSGNNHSRGLVPDPGSTAGTSKFLCENGTWATPTDTDTHWHADLILGNAASSTSGVESATSDPYLNTVEGEDESPAVSGSIQIVGGGDTTVSANSGVLTITTTLPTNVSELDNDANYAIDADYKHTDNNFTDTLKSKLDAIAEGAQVNVIEEVKVNGSALTPDANKAVDITIPAATVTDVQTSTDGSTYSTVIENNTTTAKIDLSGYALKSDLTKIMDWKGAKTGNQLKVLTGSTEKIGNVYTCTEDGTRGSGATAFEFKAGYEYVVDSISNDSNKVITWVELGKYYSVPAATGTDLGGFKTGASVTGKNYAVQLDNENKAYVNVPWTDNDTTDTAGTGTVTLSSNEKLYLIGAKTQSGSQTTYTVATSGDASGLYLGDDYTLHCPAGVHDAVWNDLIDLIPVDEECELEFGKVYCFDGNHYYQSQEYMPAGLIGINSDTGGFVMGHKEGVKELQCSVAGFVLAYVDKEYPVGTPLTAGPDGYLTEMKLEDKPYYPERILATYWKSEPSKTWGNSLRQVQVNGRKWVKVK